MPIDRPKERSSLGDTSAIDGQRATLGRRVKRYLLQTPAPDFLFALAAYFVPFTQTSADALLRAGVVFVLVSLVRQEIKTSRLHRVLAQLDEIERSNVSLLNGFRDLESASKHHHNFIPKIRTYQECWAHWRDNLPTPPEEAAWNKIMEMYLEREGATVRDGVIETTSELYTSLLSEMGDVLNTYYQGAGKRQSSKNLVYRYQLSGMLPDEFYNGHQIEYTSVDSKPIFFSHEWETYDEFYERSEHAVRRCIILRSGDITDDRIKALYTEPDLKRLKEICIKPRPHPVVEISDNATAQRLLEMNRQMNKLVVGRDMDEKGKVAGANSARELDILHKIVGRGKYFYYPMIPLPEDGACPEGYRLLLEEYAEHFHAESSDALFYVVSEQCAQHMEREGSFAQVFEAGHIPEISFFGKKGRGEGPPSEWSLGILGQWVPFTRKMKIRLLTKKESDDLANSMDFIFNPQRKSRRDSLGSPEPIMSLLNGEAEASGRDGHAV